MKKFKLTFVCPIQHLPITKGIAKSDDFVVFFTYNFFFNSIHFLNFITIFSYKIAGENIPLIDRITAHTLDRSLSNLKLA